MSTVYLPVEVTKRELLSRAFLSTRLAAAGHSVVVFKSDVFHRTGWPGPGIYIGKNFLQPPPPHDTANLEKMRAAGVLTCLLDEEGGIYPGDTEAEWSRQLASRYDPSPLAKGEKYLVWGDWQREVAEMQSSHVDVRVTGSPSFDLYQPKYAPFLKSFDEDETGGLSDFVLLNTRFVFANALNHGGSHFIHHGLVTREVPLAERYTRLASDGIRFYQFIGLVHKLSRALPNQLFILRPHPNEDAGSYAKILEPLKNVRVISKGDAGPWIRKCRCLVHNGCTTAIQAEIAGKKVISYVAPPNDEEGVAGLPNRVGYLARSDDDVLDAIGEDLPPLQKEIWRRTIGRLDAVEAITEVVSSEAERRTCADLVQRRTKMFEATEIPRKVRRLFSPARRTNAQKLNAHFDPQFFSRLPEVIRYADAYYKAGVSVRRISKAAFIITRPK